MEFFERAHVAKKNTSRKESKSEETVKKQLKQMLHGYRKSDNQLIKKSAVSTICNLGTNEDSSSVSGFSDLNITESSQEDSKIENIENIGDNYADLESISDSPCVFSKSSSVVDPDETSFESITSISKVLDYDQWLSANISEPKNSTVSDEEASLMGSLLDSFISTESNSEDSESEAFDPKGELASKILKELKNKKNRNVKKGKKRNLQEIQFHTSDEDVKVKISSKTPKFHKESEEETMSSVILTGDDESADRLSINHSINESISSSASSPYISVAAEDMQSECLNDILGGYVHSTVKNIPCEKQNIVHSINNSGVLLPEDVQNEEINSLTTELDDVPTVDDLEIQNTVDLSVESERDSTICDDSMDLDEESENDNSNIAPVKTYYGDNTCVMVLRHPTEINIHGKVKLKALGGKVEIFGYTLTSTFCSVLAPHSNIVQCIKTVANDRPFYGLFGNLTSAGLTVLEAEEIVTTIGDNDGVICLTRLSSRTIDFVENNFSAAQLFLPNKYNEHTLLKASKMLECSVYLSKPKKSFIEDEKWKEAINIGMNSQSRGIVCGGKGVGKSTFLRYYVNKLLCHGPVLWLDLDPGQAEFTVAGNVSATVVTDPLLGPNFTHLKSPKIMLNIGMINSMDNPARYAAAVCELVKLCSEDENLRSMPWVINTMGMCNNIGLKFIILTIISVQPTFLLQIHTEKGKNRFDCFLTPDVVIDIYNEYQNDYILNNAQCPENLDYKFILTLSDENISKKTSIIPKDTRYLSFLAYFGQLMEICKANNLLEIVPFEVNLKDLHIGSNVTYPEDAVLKVINGKVVALCELASHDKRRLFVLRDKPLRCHGHGLIRGIDFEKRILYIISPTPVDKLSSVNTLVYADWVPEIRGQEKYLPESIAIPYRSITEYQKRQLMASPRRRFNPVKVLMMTRLLN